MIDAEFAQRFSREWMQAWNDHDLDAVLGHYADDVVFHSPRIRTVTKRDVDFVSGKNELRAYWAQALNLLRNLYFEVDKVLVGSDAITILYTNERSQYVGETFVFDRNGKVKLSLSAYA
jgi:hypothetical protein